MNVKKAREHQFTYEGADGRLHAVVLQVQHVRDGDADRVLLQVVSDAAPVEVSVLVHPDLKRGPARSSTG